jgi:glycosyltransferase involved in cell wall biosynthesis
VWFRVNVTHLFSAVNRSALYEKLALACLARLFGCKTIFNFRNAFDRLFCRLTRFEQWLVKRLLNCNTIVLCQYQALARFLIDERIVPPHRVRVLSNGIDLSECPDPPTSLPADRKPPRILFLGTIGYRKGVDVLLRAVQRVRQLDPSGDFSLDLCGEDEDPGQGQALRALADELDVRQLVHFRGPVLGEKKAAILRQADVFVLPSTAEGFPNSLLEAMLVGLPVIVSRVGAMPEIVSPDNGFVIEPDDVSALAKHLVSLIDDPALRRKMGTAGRRKVEQQYDLERVLPEFKSLYHDVVGMRARGPAGIADGR